jgi:hypothetical protein
MWLVTDRGFYSVVDKGDRPGYLCVRGRVLQDFHNLFELDSMKGYRDELIETDDSDYRFRVYVRREDWVATAADLAAEIDYDNFKSQVARMQGHVRAHVYTKVWSALAGLQP